MKLSQKKGILNCHSHPYIRDIRPSPEDLQVALKMPWQKDFYIVSPDGAFGIYNRTGIIEIRNIDEASTSKKGAELYEKLFKES